MNKAKLKDLPVRTRIIKRHQKMFNALMIITFIPASSFALLEIVNEKMDKLLRIVSNVRENIVYTIFKIIYKKEILENERQFERSENKQ